MMSEKGILYLHINDKIGHYVKILCDEIFGREHLLMILSALNATPRISNEKHTET